MKILLLSLWMILQTSAQTMPLPAFAPYRQTFVLNPPPRACPPGRLCFYGPTLREQFPYIGIGAPPLTSDLSIYYQGSGNLVVIHKDGTVDLNGMDPKHALEFSVRALLYSRELQRLEYEETIKFYKNTVKEMLLFHERLQRTLDGIKPDTQLRNEDKSGKL